MPFSDLFDQVLSPGLCTACGLCVTVCPSGMIDIGEDGIRPVLRPGGANEDCQTCQDCLHACPGLSPGTPRAEDFLFGRRRSRSERWLGIHQGSYAAWATDPGTYERSASGGSSTTLLAAGFDCCDLDCVLVAGRDPQRPWRARSEVHHGSDSLTLAAQSTYQLFPHLLPLQHLLRQDNHPKIGIVGLACHVQAVRKLQLQDTSVGLAARRQIQLVIEIACSSNTKPEGTETLIRDIMGVRLDTVADVRYREGPYPGGIVVRTTDGLRHQLPFWAAVKHFKHYKTHRCLTCGDWMSGLADLSVCDGDPNIFRSSSEGSQPFAKHGLVLVRTDTGRQVLEWAVTHGLLQAEPAVVPDVNLGLARKRNRRAFYERADHPIPDGPIPDYKEDIDCISDDEFLATTHDQHAESHDESAQDPMVPADR